MQLARRRVPLSQAVFSQVPEALLAECQASNGKPKNSKEDGKKKLSGEGWKETTERKGSGSRMVEFELIDQRNALERALLHFAHFEKEAERIERNRYRIRVRYDKDDETELVIRVLSFGPMIRVTAPEVFVDLIRKRLIRQKHCFLKNLTEKNV